MRMVHGMILAAHHRINIPIHCIMNVGRPDSSEEDHANMRQVVARHKQHTNDIGTGLQNPINRVKGNGSPGCQCMSLVVFMMQQMDVLVHPLVRVERAVHPVNTNFHAGKVYRREEKIGKHTAQFINRVFAHGISLLHEPIGEDRKHNIEEQGRLRQRDLIENDARFRSKSVLENLLALWVHVAKVMKNCRCHVIHKSPRYKVATVTQRVTTHFDAKIFHKLLRRCRRKYKAVDPRIKISYGVSTWVALQHSIVTRQICHIFIKKCTVVVVCQPTGSWEWHFRCSSSSS
mmetsp:Transcript_4932/g.7204  ORF Transcript_4932/g.7204 Transcript_4932/m.7204 type:complete len:289 (+) Transcript_4932:201-1067(+)